MPRLLVCVEGSASDDDAAACRAEFGALARRSWGIRPQFIDQIDALPVSRPDDVPAMRIVGVLLALPEPEDQVKERAVRQDVEQLVECMSGLARRAAIEFVVEYREEEVGFLDGSPRDDRVLRDFFGE